MSDAANFAGTGPVRDAHRFDEAALGRWMQEHVEGFAGPMHVEQFKGGQSNPTYQLRTPEREYVLRRKPPGPLLKGAHAVEREARVIAAVGAAGFPVPKVFGVCEDPQVLGSAFFVMERVRGRIFWESGFSNVPQAERFSYLDAMNATLADLHRLDYVSLGLGDYGKPGRYVARQVERWSRQYMSDEAAGRNADMDHVIAWLEANLPARDETALTHGDFRADNLIFDAVEPRVIAVLDWELSTLGDPLADFAYHAMMYRLPPDILGGIGGLDFAQLGLPDEAAYVQAYCRRTGREGIADFDYYVVFNMFRFAAILHGIRARVARGTAVSEDARAMGDRFARVAQIAWREAQRAGAMRS
ncbi:phosphotransferase [Caballeronia sp. LZ065]|nr:phosphotransferase [Caballeronia sp. LZ065]MDR5782341.1 phosphotransferase [Caballeronia sp. LZ065]